MYKRFKPVRISTYYQDRIAKGISDNIYRTMFKPIFEILNRKSTVWNSLSDVVTALQNGRIYYENGAFKAVDRFSNAVAKELEKLGAKFRHGAYYIERNLLPVEVDSIISMIISRQSAQLTALDALLIKLGADLTKEQFNSLLIEHTAELMFKKLEKDLIESTSIGKVPTVGTYIEVPDLEISDEKINELNQFYENGGGGNAPEIDLNTDVVGINPPKTDGNGGNADDGNNNEDSGGGSGNNPPPPPKDEDNDGNEGGSEGNGKNNPPKTDGGKDNNPPKEEPPTIDYEKSLEVFKEDKWTKKIAKDYVYNMNYWVKKWKAREIIKMRRDVLEMVQAGARIETIEKYFIKEWKVAKDKAAFLARNESNIASSVVKAVHYQRQGCKYFMWLKSDSKEKRELHLEYAKEKGNKYGLGGTNIFSFANPPIIEQEEIKLKSGEKKVIPKIGGQRGLPGQTYNCRCNLEGIADKDYWIYQRKIENAKRNIFTKIKFAIENSKQRNNYPWRYRRFGEGQAV